MNPLFGTGIETVLFEPITDEFEDKVQTIITNSVERYVPDHLSADPNDRERANLAALLSPVPVPVDELIRQSGFAAPLVYAILLELELVGRLERHAGGRVSLI